MAIRALSPKLKKHLLMSSVALAFLDEIRPELAALIREQMVSVLHSEKGHQYPERVSVAQASEITGYSKNSLYQMHSKGKVPGALKVGGKLMFETATLRKWVNEGGNAT